jgi:hypothetical protein
MQTKRFSLNDYNKHDPAKHLIIKWFQDLGWKCEVNPNSKGVDLLAQSPNGSHWEIEVEVKKKWLTGVFKYDTLHIAGRKEKFINDHAMHVTINEDHSYFILVPTDVLLNSTRIQKDTIYTRAETFIELQIKDCKIYKLKEQQ